MFSNSDKELLNKIYENKEELTIVGINAYGDPFRTTGRITTTDNGTPAIYDEHIFLEFGKSKSSPDRKQTKYFAPYELTIRSSWIPSLVIDKIVDKDGNVVFENPDFEKQVEVAKENKEKMEKSNKEEGRETLFDDPVTTKLRILVGQPVILDGDCGVVGAVKRIDNYGNVIVDLLDGPGVCSSHVRRNSVLGIETNDGTKIKLASNDEFMFIDNLYSKRLENLHKAQGQER